jgi:Ca2+-binding RTX toxin-like protein
MNRKTLLGAVTLAAVAASIAAPVAAAAAPSLRATVTDGTLRISGGRSSEQIALRLDPADRTRLQVDVGNNGSAERTFDLGAFDAIVVDGGNGNDTIRIDQANGAFTATKPTRIDGQNGDDTIIGGSGNELLVGGRGDDFVDGNGGVDTAFLGQGDDTFVWDPGDASDVVEGGAGFDKMVFNGSGGDEIMAATAASGRVSFTRNLGGIVMDLDDVEAIDVNALDGADSVTVNDVTGTDLRRVDVDLAAALGGSTADTKADTVNVNGTKGDDSIAVDAVGNAVEVSGLAAFVRITHAKPADDEVVIDPVTGDDAVGIDPAAQALIQVSVL